MSKGWLSKTVTYAMELKARMIKEGLVDTVARDGCPHCGKDVLAALAGPKKHLRIRCVTPNCLSMME